MVTSIKPHSATPPWQHIYSILLKLVILIAVTTACPTNETLSAYCQCETSYNGLILDCSGSNAAATLAVLRENQVRYFRMLYKKNSVTFFRKIFLWGFLRIFFLEIRK